MMPCCITAVTALKDPIPTERGMPNVPAITVTGLPTDSSGGERNGLAYRVLVVISNPHFGPVTPTLAAYALLRFIAQFHLYLSCQDGDGLESNLIWSHLLECGQSLPAYRHPTRCPWSPDKQILKLDPGLPVLRSFGTVRGCDAQRTQDIVPGNYKLLLISRKTQ
jgi:hypothetical protein